MQERKTARQAKFDTADEPPPLLHPSMAYLYRSKVEELASALQREDARTGDLFMPVQMVAGAGNQRYLQLWLSAA